MAITQTDYAIAFIDYDNVAMELFGRGDTVPALAEIVHVAVEAVRRDLPFVRTLDLRLYGGWLDESGFFSSPAARLLPELRRFRGLRGGIRIATSLALALRGVPDCRLIGSLRVTASRRRQKMVDGMLTLDICFSASDPGVVVMISDDDDLVPAALMASRAGGTVHWLRLRDRPSCNDAMLDRELVVFHPLR